MNVLKFLRKLQVRKSVFEFNLANFIDIAPPEIFEEIFNKLQIKDVLKCRLLCQSIRLKIDHHYTRKLKIILKDQKHGKRLLHYSITIKTDKLCIENLVTTTMTRWFVQKSFIHLKTIEMSGQITTKNFLLIIQEIPNFEIFEMHSLTLGGPLNFLQVNLKNQNRNVRIQKLRITLDYVPLSTKGFSSLRLITNLKAVQFWDLKFLNTITFKVEPSTFNEQFYFGFYTFLVSIPISSYETLQNLKISCPKLKPENSSTLELMKFIFEKIKFKNLELRFQSFDQVTKPELQISRNIVLQFANELGLNARVLINE